MSRNLLLGVSAMALAACLVATAPAHAQVIVPDASIEGPIQTVTPYSPDQTSQFGPLQGEMNVMGVTVKVLRSAPIHTATNPGLTLNQLQTPGLPGRPQAFIGGTAIITGDSVAGILYASDVFVEVAENVVVGEATGTTIDHEDDTVRSTINNVIIIPLTDSRTPASSPLDAGGFEIDPTTIPPGVPFSVEGYYAGGRIYYHTLEADAGTLLNPTTPQVSILRAQCRTRNDGRSRDELEVRGGTVNPAGGLVTIQRLLPNQSPASPSSWVNVLPVNVVPVVDALTNEGLYRYTASNLNLGPICPAQVRAVMRGTTAASAILATSAGFSPDSR